MWMIGVVFLILLLIMLPIVVLINVELQKTHANYSAGVINHDMRLREFCYRTEKSKEEIWEELGCHHVYTSTKFRFNSADGIITFYSELPDGNVDVSYGIHVLEREGTSFLKIVQSNHFWEKNKYVWLMNEFWHQKLGATPVPYTDFPS